MRTKEEIKKENYEKRSTIRWLVIGVLAFILLLVYSTFSILLEPVKIEGKINCDTGELGLTYNLNNSGNLTLNGIKNMNCNIEYKGEIPFGKLMGYLE